MTTVMWMICVNMAVAQSIFDVKEELVEPTNEQIEAEAEKYNYVGDDTIANITEKMSRQTETDIKYASPEFIRELVEADNAINNKVAKEDGESYDNVKINEYDSDEVRAFFYSLNPEFY